MLDYNKISKKYIEGQYVKPMNKSSTLMSKEDLFDLLKCWSMLSTENTIGDLNKYNGNKKIILIITQGKSYYMNADTTKDGVKNFLANKMNAWFVVNKSKRVTNDSSKRSIKGLYIYISS